MFHKKSNVIPIVFWVAILVGGAVYFWMQSFNATKEAQLKTEINRLQMQMSQVEKVKDNDLVKLNELKRRVNDLKTEVRNGTETATKPTSTTTPTERVAQKPTEPIVVKTIDLTPTIVPTINTILKEEVKFDECGHVTTFIFKDWYAKLESAATALNVNLRDGASACYSENGNTLVFLIPAEGCTMGDFYRFNPLTGQLNKAAFNGKGAECTPSPTLLGKREGVVLKMTGSAQADCKWKTYYDYNYLKNTVELYDYRTLCAGDTEWQWAEF